LENSPVKLINIRTLGDGRRAVAQTGVATVASDMKLPELVTHCRESAAFDEKLISRKREWVASRSTESADLRPYDQAVDRFVGAIYRQTTTQLEAPLDPAMAECAQRVLTSAFPSGLAAVTQASYPDEIGASKDIVAKLRGPNAADANHLRLGSYLDALDQATRDFEVALTRIQPVGLTYDQIRADQAEGQARLIETVMRICGAFPSRSAEHAAARAQLLAPILRQDAQVREYRSRHRAVPDVDPKTGQEIPTPAPEFVAPEA